jgi:hypothetical protein
MRYHFNLHEGTEVIPDKEGSEFATFTAARAEARASLLDLVRDDIRSGRPAIDWRIEIADREGRLIDSIGLDFFSTEYLKPAAY